MNIVFSLPLSLQSHLSYSYLTYSINLRKDETFICNLVSWYVLEHDETVAVDAHHYKLQSKQLCKHLMYRGGGGEELYI